MVKIRRTTKTISIQSEYSPDLPKRARKLSGKWDSIDKEWYFPIEAEKQVAELYRDIYGQWDDILSETVTLLCTASNGSEWHGSLCLHSRVIATATGRDSGANTANGVIVLKGGFNSGGSVKNWRTCVGDDGITFRLLDVPLHKAEKMIKDTQWCDSIEIEQTEKIDIETLKAEKNRLLKRISEIDKLIESENI